MRHDEKVPGDSVTLFTNIGRLYTFAALAQKEGRHPKADDLSALDDAAMLVSDSGEIQWIGARAKWSAEWSRLQKASRRKLKKPKAISLRGQTVMPALVECHTHLLYAGSRAEEFERRNRGDSYLEIAASGGGIRSTVKATAQASARELETALVQRLEAFVRQGVTTVEIKTGYAATIEEEKRHLEILIKLQKRSNQKASNLPRLIVTCLAAHSIPEGETEETWLRKVETLLPSVKKAGARLDIFIEKGAFSLTSGEAVLAKAAALGIPVTVHADQLSRAGGTALGTKLHAQSVDHVIEASTQDIKELARSSTVAVLLPAADLYTRLPYPKARAMVEAGVRVALATDHNPGTSPGLDVALVGVLARTAMQMTLPEVFAAYTVNAAAALGFGAKLGALEVGRFADFVSLKPGAGPADLFYEIGPTLTHAAIAGVWRGGRNLKWS